MKASRTRSAFLHLPGYGPRKIETLQARGIANWDDLLHHHHHDLPGFEESSPDWVKAIRRDEAALAAGDLAHLVATLHRSDHWRILADFRDRATYLDIETSGDQLRPEITLIIVKHRGVLHTFTAEHNLEAFLPLLDEISLLVTFNGASFDVPQLENHFHIPLRDLPHIDLRWSCYHAGLRGGLKEIERSIGLVRPADLIGMDGGEADWLWRRWKDTGNRSLLQRLTRYCAADVVGLEHLAHWLFAHLGGEPYPSYQWDDLRGLPASEASAPTPAPPPPASPDRHLRDRLRRSLRSS
ncbi:MAG TPA: ribonuclease H-like domain-containing protein [Kiritimatiellia bacterium]|nr:ribonuclease H-like domain-containing protein [Kiritimatiellia bacterium]HMP35641.1 ribonuclease H-like domain-containing protein [Kiritimatiellia bacterium]